MTDRHGHFVTFAFHLTSGALEKKLMVSVYHIAIFPAALYINISTISIQVYLVDFGLACRFASDGVHKEYKPDVRKAHNGTIEFTSRDAHIGAMSRRGDLEILGYNLLQWASGTLPWMDKLQNAGKVAAEKNSMMDDVPALVKTCFPNGLPKGAGRWRGIAEWRGKGSECNRLANSLFLRRFNYIVHCIWCFWRMCLKICVI